LRRSASAMAGKPSLEAIDLVSRLYAFFVEEMDVKIPAKKIAKMQNVFLRAVRMVTDNRKGSANTQIHMLRPRKEGNIWVFDDPENGLRNEAFVPNASGVIDKLVEIYGVKPKNNHIDLLFGSTMFPGATRLELVAEDKGHTGVTYKWPKFGLEAWLCPAFYCYFDPTEVPRELYAMAA
jgi:hypothetical protein